MKPKLACRRNHWPPVSLSMAFLNIYPSISFQFTTIRADRGTIYRAVPGRTMRYPNCYVHIIATRVFLYVKTIDGEHWEQIWSILRQPWPDDSARYPGGRLGSQQNELIEEYRGVPRRTYGVTQRLGETRVFLQVTEQSTSTFGVCTYMT